MFFWRFCVSLCGVWCGVPEKIDSGLSSLVQFVLLVRNAPTAVVVSRIVVKSKHSAPVRCLPIEKPTLQMMIAPSHPSYQAEAPCAPQTDNLDSEIERALAALKDLALILTPGKAEKLSFRLLDVANELLGEVLLPRTWSRSTT